MKDLRFTGGALTTPVTFRVDSISGNNNLTVMETYGLDDRRPQTVDTDIEKALLSNFKKLNYTMQEFIAFATTNSLDLTVSDTNGDNAKSKTVNLVVSVPTNAATTSTTPTFSGTGTPGASVVVTVGSVVNSAAIVAANGTWSKVSSALTTGAKTASVVLTKDGVSKTVSRNFTVA